MKRIGLLLDTLIYCVNEDIVLRPYNVTIVCFFMNNLFIYIYVRISYKNNMVTYISSIFRDEGPVIAYSSTEREVVKRDILNQSFLI